MTLRQMFYQGTYINFKKALIEGKKHKKIFGGHFAIKQSKKGIGWILWTTEPCY